MSAARRLDSLEGLRFLSSVAIVIGHYVPYAVGETPRISRLHLAVDLFFVISGIVIANAYGGRIASLADWLRFMLRRIARLYPLHLATLGFYVAIGVLVWSGRVHPADAARYDASAIVPNLLLIHAWLPTGRISFNYVCWSISAEFFVYLAFPLIALALRGRAATGLIGIVALFALFASIAETQVGLPLTRLSWQAGVLRAVPGFAFGVWLHSHAGLLDRLAPRLAAWALAGLLAVLALLLVVPISQYATLAVIWAMVAVAYRCDRAALATPLSVRWLSNRGALTYSLYMLHPVLATIFLAVVFPKLLGVSPPARWLGVALTLPLLYAAAVASLRWFEQPARRAISGWADEMLPARRHQS